MNCIYLIKCKLNDLQYVGECEVFKDRMYHHKSSKQNSLIHKAIRKHGWENFTRDIIVEGIPAKERKDKEDYYMDFYNTIHPNGYNARHNKGFKLSEEHKEKLRQAKANRDQIGSVRFDKSRNKWRAYGPCPDSKHIGQYFTEEKARRALYHFNTNGLRMESDRIRRNMGTITKRRERYQAQYKKNKKFKSKTFDTEEECEEWIKLKLNS